MDPCVRVKVVNQDDKISQKEDINAGITDCLFSVNKKKTKNVIRKGNLVVTGNNSILANYVNHLQWKLVFPITL